MEALQSPFLAKKIQKILDNDLNQDQDTLEALRALSEFFTNNTIQNRRNLRSNFEKRSLTINQEFLSSFNEINQALDSLCNNVGEMQILCEKMQQKIKDTQESNAVPFSKIAELQEKKTIISQKKSVLNRFLETFQLNEDEINCLNGATNIGTQPITDRFFNVLDKVKLIHDQSKQLLIESDQQTAAIEIMDSMCKLEEQAFDRLYRWLIEMLRMNALSWDQSQSNPLIFKGIAYLQPRKVIYRYCLDEYGVVRRGVLVKNFLDYLSKTSSLASGSGINAMTPETEKVLEGILKWLSDAFFAEKQLLVYLLRQCDQQELEHGNDVKDYLSFITATLCQPGKSRIEHLLAAETDCVRSFRVRNQLKKHQKLFSAELNRQSEFIYFINELCALSHRVFINNLNFFFSYRLGKYQESEELEEVSSNLSPTGSFVVCNKILTEVLQFDQIPNADERQELLINILNVSIGSYLSLSELLARNLTTTEQSIFLLNCLQPLFKILAQVPNTQEFTTSLAVEIDKHKTTLGKENLENVLKYNEMYTVWQHICRRIDSNSFQAPLSTVAGCDALSLRDCAKKLENYLNSHKAFISAQLLLIKDHETREGIEKYSKLHFAKAYRQIYDQVHDPTNLFEDPDSILPKRVEEVCGILEVQC